MTVKAFLKETKNKEIQRKQYQILETEKRKRYQVLEAEKTTDEQ